MITRKHSLDKYTQLRAEFKQLDLPIRNTLMEWTGLSGGKLTRVLSGRQSFEPEQMEKILTELGYERSEAVRLFPPFGEDIELNHESQKKLDEIRRILQ